MTKQEAITQYSDELRGLLAEAFAKETATVGDMAEKGRWIVYFLRKALPLVTRIFEDAWKIGYEAGRASLNGQPQTKGATHEQPQQGTRQPGR